MELSTAERGLMVVGGQWGDEGKGKVVDLLAAGHRVVVRYNGGHNAGHTVRFGERRFALHLVPSGIIHEGCACYMASGMVVDPLALVAEIDRLQGEGLVFADRLRLSPRATLILPTHAALDGAREGARGSERIGTTGRGIGPAYADRATRRGLRADLLANPDRFAEQARELIEEHNHELERLHGVPPVDAAAAVARLRTAAARLAPLLEEVGPALRRHAARGEAILFEGAQGVMLDQCWGTYPFVTSSSCLPTAAAISCGVSASLLGPVLGIMKAYVTRVGGGPFPSELDDATGEVLRTRGVEFGTTTGRPRRCGWFDAVAARYAVEVAGIDAVALMKMDVLDGLDRLRVAVAYERADGSRVSEMPADTADVAAVRPVYEDLPGWAASTEGVTDEKGLPAAAHAYLRRLEKLLGVPIVLVSTGPRREETLIRGTSPLAGRLRRLLALDPVPS